MSSPLIIDEKSFEVKKEISEQVKQEVEENIPSEFITIKLPSNGKIEGIPKILHFRDYSASESLDINTPKDEDKPNAIAKVLTSMCYEGFDVSLLPIEDVLYILFVLQGTYINSTITKQIYLDEKKEDIDSADNVEEVEIPINKLKFCFLGKDKDDNDLDKKIKIPFKITDNKTNHVIEFKLATLKDSIIAQNYCKKYFEDELLKFSPIRKKIIDIQEIKSAEKRESEIDKFMSENIDDCTDYYEFMNKYAIKIAECVQALQIYSYDGKKTESLDECWDIYSNKLSTNIWNTYNFVLKDFNFGLNKEVEVYSNKLQKKLVRNINFQLSDFISINETKDDDRYSVSFD